jgi:hypothetical protein
MPQGSLILGTITKAKLLEEVASTITHNHSSTAAQFFNKVLQHRKFVCPLDGSGGALFEKCDRVYENDHLYRRQVSENIFLFKDLHNKRNKDYPFIFHEVKPATIDIAKVEKSIINKILDEYGPQIRPEERGDKAVIAVVLSRIVFLFEKIM